jgi:hypothetical protein
MENKGSKKMAKININTKQIGEIVKKRYEVVALVGIAFVALVCLVLGSLKFLGATDPEPKIVDAKKKIEALRVSAPLKLTAKDGKKIRDTNEWDQVKAGFDYPELPGHPYFESGAAGENRREQPRILAVDTGPKAIQWNYVQSGVYTFDLRQSDSTVNVANKTKEGFESYFFNVQAKRMVIVAGSFPYLDQCEQFKKALRLDTIHELFTRGLAPTFEGIIVERCEVGADGKCLIGADGKEAWVKIYGYDVKDGKGVVAEPIQNLLKTCLYDEKEDYADVIYGPTVTPLPMLVRGEYPKIEIGGFDKRPAIAKLDKTSIVKLPIGARRGHFELTPVPRRLGEDAPLPKLDSLDIEKLPKIIKEQFKGELNWFDPHGQFIKLPDEKDKDGESKDGQQPDPDKGPGKITDPDKIKGFKDPDRGKQPGPGYPQTLNESPNPRQPSALPPWPKALIRFVDVDVEPGKAYKYRFKLRLANPNYKQSTKIVLNSEFTKIKEFETPGWAVTDTIYIPRDYFFYVANYPTIKYQGKDHPKIYSHAGGAGGNSREIDGSKAQDKVAFQIHTFVDSFTDDELQKHQVSDWLVAERILVGRGEPVGRKVEVEVIEWDKYKNMFEIKFNSKTDKKLEKTTGFKKGIGVDFSPKNQIILLDFAGGHHRKYSFAKGADIYEDSATEVLLLMPDNSLIVRNSRNDMNDEGWDSKLASPNGHVYGVERRQRFEAWRERLEKLRKEEKGEKGGN